MALKYFPRLFWRPISWQHYRVRAIAAEVAAENSGD
jgi:hypothetical protein